MRRGTLLVVVFARAPLAGRAKTRLGQRLGPYRAARFHARLVDATLGMAVRAGAAAVELHADSRTRNAELRHIGAKHRVRLRHQRGSDLGERMHDSIRRGLRRYSAVALIGSDCPPLAARHIGLAWRALAGGCEAAFVPTEDGGYSMIALRRTATAPFECIEWGRSTVFDRSQQRLAAMGWRVRSLSELWDVDRPSDLDRNSAQELRLRRVRRTKFRWGPRAP